MSYTHKPTKLNTIVEEPCMQVSWADSFLFQSLVPNSCDCVTVINVDYDYIKITQYAVLYNLLVRSFLVSYLNFVL